MNVIIAAFDNNIPYLAFDPRSSSGSYYFTLLEEDEKCFNGSFVNIEFGVIGSGRIPAEVAFKCLDLPFKDKCAAALEKSAEFDSGCGAPFYLLNCGTGKYENL